MNPTPCARGGGTIPRVIGSMAAALLVAMSPSSPAGTPVPTPKHPVVDTYFGTKITDDYRWLEAGGDPAVLYTGRIKMRKTPTDANS